MMEVSVEKLRVNLIGSIKDLLQNLGVKANIRTIRRR